MMTKQSILFLALTSVLFAACNNNTNTTTGNTAATTTQPATTTTQPVTVTEQPATTISNPNPPDDATAMKLASFYTGECTNGGTQLTLNADKDRTFSLNESGKSEVTGYWTIANGVVSLTAGSTTYQYKLAGDDLVALAGDKCKLKKVMGE